MNKKYTSLSLFIKDYAGAAAQIVSKNYVSGGDINDAYKCTLSDGKVFFLKANRGKSSDFFHAEALGLDAILSTNTISVPSVLGYGDDPSLGSFLAIEYLEQTPRISDFWAVFAKELADLHKADTSGLTREKKYGFSDDNYIGATPQKNTGRDSWIEFFRDVRLRPQFDRAKGYFSTSDMKNIDKFLDKLDDILVEPAKPSLIHGDLWGGNFITGPDGRAWLIDPAAYVGCAEADIAMTSLFGGFAPEFYESYREYGLLMDGYVDRVDIYNLYHLLNHLNLFGGGYLSGVIRIIRKYT